MAAETASRGSFWTPSRIAGCSPPNPPTCRTPSAAGSRSLTNRSTGRSSISTKRNHRATSPDLGKRNHSSSGKTVCASRSAFSPDTPKEFSSTNETTVAAFASGANPAKRFSTPSPTPAHFPPPPHRAEPPPPPSISHNPTSTGRERICVSTRSIRRATTS